MLATIPPTKTLGDTQTVLATKTPDTQTVLATKIGEGSYACVYAVSDSKCVTRALKLSQHKDEFTKDAAQREVKALTALAGKPHIVQMIYTAQTDAYTAIYMECAATNLHLCIFANWLSADAARVAIHHILLGIKSCHDAGIIHRDVRPDNILLCADQWKLADFGSASMAGFTDHKKAVFAHVAFRAPEMYRDIHVSAQDIWALGIVITTILTKTYIFFDGDERHSLGTIFQILGIPDGWPYKMNGTPMGLGKYLELKDVVLLDLLERMLQVDPAKRITADDALKHKYFTQ